MTADIQWYIARDGKQYGPLSDPEMGLFVRGGHLKPEDLVWRAGFADWTPALVAFPPPAPPPAVKAPPPAPDAAPRTAQPYQQPAYQPAHGGGTPSTGVPGSRPADAAPGAFEPAVAQRPVTGRAAARDPVKSATATPGGRSVVAVEQGFPDDAVIDDGRSGSRLGRLALVTALLVILAGGGWLAYQKRDTVKSLISAMTTGSKGRTVATDPSAPAFVVEGGGPADAIDARFQRTALWSVVKREFPEWYGERLQEAVRLTSEKKPEATVTKHLLEALVALRRKHATDALAASSARLVTIADAFLANLKRISAHSTTTCYSFISQGEASPAIIDLVQQRGTDADLAAQVTAIFEAIAEGRRSPVKYAAPEKADYDALAEQLTKLGWSQADLQLFADPRALARTSHDRVCKMVQDWFSAHIAVKDRGAQERLLIETLRPVVAG